MPGRLVLALGALAWCTAGCAQHDAGEATGAGQAALGGLAPASLASGQCPGSGGRLLPAWLLDHDDPREVEETIERCLTVTPAGAEAFARGYAAQAMGVSGPVEACLRVPVEDEAGTLIAHRIIVAAAAAPGESASGDAGDGYRGLTRAVDLLAASVDERAARGGDPEASRFVAINRASVGRFFTIDVAARLFRHPVRDGHQGLPRWIIEKDEVTRQCRGATPVAVVPAPGLASARELVRYRCADGSQVLFSHYADAVMPPGLVTTRHDPGQGFARWAQKTRAYPDPEQRLRFLEGLWLRDSGRRTP